MKIQRTKFSIIKSCLMFLILFLFFIDISSTLLSKMEKSVKSQVKSLKLDLTSEEKHINYVSMNHIPISSLDANVTDPSRAALTSIPEKIDEDSFNTIENSINKTDFSDSKSLNNNDLNLDYKIDSMSQTFVLDSKLKTCDIFSHERVKFSFGTETSLIDYIIISKKTPLYKFKVNIVNTDRVYIKNVRIYEDSSFRQRIFVDSSGRRIMFRDRFLISTELSTPVKEIELEYSYIMQRAILIDSINEANYLKFILINPHSQTVQDYNLSITLLNFSNLKPEQLRVPSDSKVISNGTKKLQITTVKPFLEHTEYEVNLSLPYEIQSCEGNFINVVYYGLIGMSALFLIMSIFTLSYLYKE